MGDLSVKLGADTSDFNSKFAGASKTMNNFKKNVSSGTASAAAATNKASSSIAKSTKNMQKNFKDVTRIAQGIIISQAFYKVTNAIQGATSALAHFCSLSERAQVSFAIMLKDADKATRLMANLKDFAADTPLTFEQASQAARKLLAYGFDSSGLRTVMNTLADASSASGSTETFESVAKALGQINTKGRLAQQEVLQLTEAGIPAFQILKEELGLTADQIARIGELQIPADVAIKAMLAGMNKRYGGAAEAMSNTVDGMLSTIKDNALIIGQEAADPMYQSFKKTLTKIRDMADQWRAILRAGGIGALMRELIPAELFPKIQILSAQFKMMKQNVQLFYVAIKPLIQAIGTYLVNALSIVVPIINGFLRVLATLMYLVNSNNKFVRGLVGAIMSLFVTQGVIYLLLHFTMVLKRMFIIKAIISLVKGLAVAIRFLSAAILTNPWIALIGVAAGALLYFGMTSKKVSGWISNIGSSISKAFGMDPSKEYVPDVKDNTDTTSEFNKELKNSSKALEDVKKKAKDANKAAKNAMMSFDEVFTIPDKDETDTAGLDDIEGLGDMTIPDISPGGIDMPNTGSLVDAWIKDFKDKWVTRMKNAAIGAAIGAVIGAIIGGLIGGPQGALIGAKIGALAGAIAGWFWQDMPASFREFCKTDLLTSTIIALLTAAIVGAFGGGLAAKLASAALAVFAYKFGRELGNKIAELLHVDLSLRKDMFKVMNVADIGFAIAAAIASAIGLIGAPIGVAIAAAIGTAELSYPIGQKIGEILEDMGHSPARIISESSITAVGALIGLFVAGPLGAAVGAAIGGAIGFGVGTWVDIFSEYSMAEIGAGFKLWGEDIAKGTGESFAAVGTACSDGLTTLQGFTADLMTKLTEADEALGDWASSGIKSVGKWASKVGTSIGTWATKAEANVKSFTSSAKTKITDWTSTTAANVTLWCTNRAKDIGGFATKAVTSISNWWTKTKAKLTAFTKFSFSDWAKNQLAILKKWAGDVWDAINDKIGKAINKLKDFLGLGNDNKVTVSANVSNNNTSKKSTTSARGHATGGVFNKEHWAPFAEGNKREAIIPLENNSAMQPFVDAVSQGITATLAPIIANMSSTSNNGSDLRPLYVGTLVADDQGLRELERKMKVIRISEERSGR